jgi:hypothetical protein
MSANNLITYNLTGLRWMGGPIYWTPTGSTKEVTWAGAVDDSLTRKVCGEGDWGVPNILELLSLACYGRVDDCPKEIIPQLGYYSGSTTTYAGETKQAWVAYSSGYDVGVALGEKTSLQKVIMVKGDGSSRIPATGQTTSYYPFDEGDRRYGAARRHLLFADPQGIPGRL